MHTTLSSRSSTVVIGHDQPFCVIGERINPTGRRIFQDQLRNGDMSAIERDVATIAYPAARNAAANRSNCCMPSAVN